MSGYNWNLKNVANESVIIISKSVFKVGRNAQADLITDHREVSRNHATLSISNDGLLYVTDHTSSNGTFINGVKIKSMELTQIKHGDIVGFGWHQDMCEEMNFTTPPLVFNVSEELPVPVLEISVVSTTNTESCVDEIDIANEDDDCVIIKPQKFVEEVEKRVQETSSLKEKTQVDDCIIVSGIDSSQIPDKVENEKLPENLQKDGIQETSSLKEKAPIEDCTVVPAIESSKIPDEQVKEKSAVSSTKLLEDLRKHKSSFSLNNQSVAENCIVLSSDDEDEPFKNSQIFAISKQIKQEQTSLHESVDPYAEIKHELEDLDYCDAQQIVVDVTDDIDHFESTSDLLNILGEEEPSTCTVVDNRQRNNTNPGSSREHDIVTEKRESKRQQKYSKPPIIAPHFIGKRSEVGRESPARSTMKRKSSSKQEDAEVNKKLKVQNKSRKEAEEQKKHLTKTTSVSNETKATIKINKADSSRNEMKVNTTDTTKNLRKKGLTSLQKRSTFKHENMKGAEKLAGIVISKTEKSKCASRRVSADTSRNKSNLRDTGKTATSESRGKFLLHEIDVPPIVQRSGRDPRTVYQSCAQNERKDKTSQNSIQDTTVSSNLSPSSDDVAIVLREHSAKKCAVAHPDTTNPEDRSGLIWKLGAFRQPAKLPHISRIVDDLNEDICAVVNWSVKWLLEQGSLDVSPPVNGNRPLLKVPSHFRGFAEYDALMNPLIKLELWQFIYQTTFNKEDERTPMKARILHERKVYPVCFLDCELFLSDAENNANPFRPEDFSLIEIRLKDSNCCYLYTSYGYLKNVQRNTSRDGHHVKLTIVTKHYAEELSGTRIFIKVIANIGNYLRLIRTIKYLELSPICKYVLKPDNLEPIVHTTKALTNLMPMELNRIQREIVAEASQVCLKDGPGMYLINGPPGTGKSTVIVGIIMEMLLNNQSGDQPPLILLTAPSNAAVDGLILKLSDARSKLPDSIRRNLKLVRIGPNSSISQNVNKFKLEVLARNNIISCKGLSSLIAYKKSVEKGEDSDVFLKQHLGSEYSYELRVAEDTLLLKSNIICTTLSSCVSHRILQATRRGPLNFTCCIVDEATQCNELESLLPIQLGIQKFVLVGDPKQLPAVVCNKEAQKLGFGQSLFCRILDNLKIKPQSPVKMLCEQYRMKPEICEYPNKTFYDGKLQSLMKCSNHIEPALQPYLVFNLTRLSDDRSDYTNIDEVCLIKKLLESLSACVKPSCVYSIGIITPYRAQKELIIQRLSGLRINSKVSITINTVDSFQGMENDVIIISSVRNKNNNFVQNEQRLNVALTRAKQALYVIGNYALFKHCKPLYDLREDAKKRKLLLDITEDPKKITNFNRYILKTSSPYHPMNTGS